MRRQRAWAWALRAVEVALIGSFVTCAIASAAVVSQWNNDTSGNFSDPANWDNGIPGPADTAVFRRPGATYTVEFVGDVVTDKLRVGRNTVTLRPSSAGGTLTVSDQTSYPFTPASVVIGESAGDIAVVNSYLPSFSAVSIVVGDYLSFGTLNVNSGSVNCTTAEVPGRGSLAKGVATVNGTDSSWNITGDFYVGYRELGSLQIVQGGKVNSGNSYLGGFGIADVTVDGADSDWMLTGTLSIDSPESSNTGPLSTLTISNGGSITSMGGQIAGNSFGDGISKITVDGVGSSWHNSAGLSIGLGERAGNGELEILRGGHVTSNTGRIRSVGNGMQSRVTVDGVGSVWNNSTNLQVGVSPGSSELHITNGGAVTVGTYAYIVAGREFTDSSATAAVTVDGPGSSLTIGRDLYVGTRAGATLTITNGGRVTDASAVVYPKSVNMPGTVLVSGLGSNWTTSGDLYLYGVLTVSNGAHVVVGGMLSIQEEGELRGNASVVGSVLNEVLVAPGLSPGTLTITGNYTQGAVGTLEIELGGISPATGFDRLFVTGNVSLDGMLKVAAFNQFAPALGDAFDILDWGALSGEFTTLQFPALGDALAWDTSQLYTTGVISVAAVPEPASAILLGFVLPMLAMAARQSLGIGRA